MSWREHKEREGGIAPYVASLLTPAASRLAYATHRLLHWLSMPCVAFHGEPRAAGARGQRALVRIKTYPCVALYGASRVRRGFGGKAPIRRAALIVSMLALASCGFEPLQGKAYREKLAVDLSAVSVNVVGSSLNITNNTTTIPRRYGQLLKAEIEDNVNPKNTPTTKQFVMDIAFTESDVALFVNPDGTASRGDLNYASTYTIKRLMDGATVASGAIRRISSYNSSPTADFASYVSIEDARRRGMLELAQDYKLRLASLLPTLNATNATAIEAKPEAPAPELQPVRHYETIRSGN